MLVPDLCVDIISQTDQYSDVLKKVRGYLRDGVRLVWLVDPSEQTIALYTQGSQQSTLLSGDDMLGGGVVVAGFGVRVSDVFATRT